MNNPALRAPTSLAGVLGLTLALGRRHLVELFFAHRHHRLRRALQFAPGRIAALRRQSGTGGLLLRFRFGRHGVSPLWVKRSSPSQASSECDVAGDQPDGSPALGVSMPGTPREVFE